MPMVQTPIDAAAGAATNGGRRPTVVAAPAAASPELSARPRRRGFTAQGQLRILADTEPPAAAEANAGVDRPATASRAGSAACATLRRPGAGRNLRQPAR